MFPFQQLNFLKHFLGGGFIKHMQENEFLHDVFNFSPKKSRGRRSSEEKVCFFYSNMQHQSAYYDFILLNRLVLTKLDLLFSFCLLQMLFQSQNSALNKARTQFLNKQRMLAKVL